MGIQLHVYTGYGRFYLFNDLFLIELQLYRLNHYWVSGVQCSVSIPSPIFTSLYQCPCFPPACQPASTNDIFSLFFLQSLRFAILLLKGYHAYSTAFLNLPCGINPNTAWVSFRKAGISPAQQLACQRASCFRGLL